jgi:hypothetical protein
VGKMSFDRVTHASAGRAGRREALGVLAAVGASALGALGLAAPAGTKKKKRKRAFAPPRPPVVRFGPRATTEEACAESFADCTPGERAVGGGHELTVGSASPVTFLGSNPSPLEDGAIPTQWFASVCTAAAGAKTIQAYAVCVPD